MRARIVCPVVKRSCGFEDATIFRGAFGGTQQRGSFHSRERQSRVSVHLSLSPSLTNFGKSFVLDEGKKKTRSTIDGHWRARKERERFRLERKEEPKRETVLFFCSAGTFLTAIASCATLPCPFKQFEINGGEFWRR